MRRYTSDQIRDPALRALATLVHEVAWTRDGLIIGSQNPGVDALNAAERALKEQAIVWDPNRQRFIDKRTP